MLHQTPQPIREDVARDPQRCRKDQRSPIASSAAGRLHTASSSRGSLSFITPTYRISKNVQKKISQISCNIELNILSSDSQLIRKAFP
jgi:hypothetical protein